MLDCICENSGKRDVLRVEEVRYVSVSKDLARIQSQQGRLWYARIRTAQPQDLRDLFRSNGREQIGTNGGCLALNPCLIGSKELINPRWGGRVKDGNFRLNTSLAAGSVGCKACTYQDATYLRQCVSRRAS